MAPAAGLQERTRATIEDLPRAFPETPMLLTCRVLSYQEERWRLDSDLWPSFELAQLDEGKIKTFIRAWYDQLAAMKVVSDPSNLSKKLIDAVNRTDISRLAGNPLLLTVMAVVHSGTGELPDARSLLYEEVVDLLLLRWEKVKLKAAGKEATGLRKLMAEADLKDIDIKQTLWEVAFEAHGKVTSSGDNDATADIPEATLHKAFRLLHPLKSLDWADKVLQVIRERAGMLLEVRPGIYGFPHRTFEEYLAACHLSNLPDFTDRVLELSGGGDFWRVVILLSVGRLVHHGGDVDKPLMLLSELCPEKAPSAGDDRALKNARLAAECLLEIGLQRASRREMGERLTERIRARLMAAVSGDGSGLYDSADILERAGIGIVLGRLGDWRKGVGLVDGDPDIDWIPIEPGTFVMGSEDEEADGDEAPRFECDLIRGSYGISRYPVTVSQYRAFVSSGGYGENKYWTDAGWKWRLEKNIEGPETYREIYQTPNHPQVGVSWYEAMAFCAWLSDRLGYEVTLPDEAQWERAARHTDGRKWPWGNAFEASRGNFFETGIKGTSTVGLFSDGNAACGLADMAGNVLEWCLTKWRDDYEEYALKTDSDPEGGAARVLRGGAFYNHSGDVRCSYRYFNPPVGRNLDLGFRVVAPGL